MRHQPRPIRPTIEFAGRETSICKVFVAEAVNRVFDRALQICGGKGVSDDLPLADFYAEARAFRIYDGPSEVHRMLIARRVLGSEMSNPPRREQFTDWIE